MQTRSHSLKDGSMLMIREALVEDACDVIEYINCISGESDFLTFGPGEFEFGEDEERELLGKYRGSANQVFILGLMTDTIVSVLNFSAGHRPRVRHSGEFGISVRKQFWGLGIASLMVDSLVDWARQTQIIRKLNLRVRTDNHRALMLYERKGFVKEGTICKEIFVNGRYYDHHWMGMEL